jgi:outer membrane protein OmpA-like peptidoglycan-associated protein
MTLSRPALILLAFALPSTALAAEAISDADLPRFNAQNLHFVVNDGDPRDPLTVRRPGRFAAGDWHAGMVWEYADGLAQQTLSEDETLPILDNSFGVHVGGGYALHDRLRMDVALPLYLASTHVEDVAQSIGAGDLRLSATIAIVQPEDTSLGGGLGVALVPWLDLPTGTEDQWLGQPGWSGGGSLAATYETEKLTVSGEVGLSMPARSVPEDFTAGDGLIAGLGVGYLVQEKTGVNLEWRAGPKLVATESLGAKMASELWATTRHRYDDGGHILGGLAVGLNDAAGTADWRIVIGGGLGRWDDPTPPDTDGDGIHDKLDQCVNKPETENGWKDDDGCPDTLGIIKLHATYRGKDVPAAVTLTTPDGEQPLKVGDKPLEFQAMPELDLSATATALGCLKGEGAIKTVEGDNDFAIPMELADAAKVRFKVVDTDGNVIPKAKIGFRDGPKMRACAPEKPVTTDDKGMSGAAVSAGAHTAVVRAKGFAIGKAAFDTTKIGASVVEVTLQPTRIELSAKDIKILEKVFFETGSGVIMDKSFPLLDEIAVTLVANPQITKVEIQGHTDNKGPDASNLKLSQTRADSVVTYLVAKGVDAKTLVAKGYGETAPVAENKTRADRAANRRVEFKILEQAAVKK